MPKFEITRKEWIFIAVITAMAFFFTTRNWILFLNNLTPITGLIIYYLIITLSLYLLSMTGFVIFGKKIKTFGQIFGASLVIFAFFIIFNWENPYIQYVTTGSLEGASPIFYQSEDGVSWFFWSKILPTASIDVLRFFAFIVTVFITSLGAALLIRRGGIRIH